jgi:hypothetical protein
MYKSDLTSEEWSKIIQEVEYDTFRKWNEGDKELLDWQKQVADQEVVKYIRNNSPLIRV